MSGRKYLLICSFTFTIDKKVAGTSRVEVWHFSRHFLLRFPLIFSTYFCTAFHTISGYDMGVVRFNFFYLTFSCRFFTAHFHRTAHDLCACDTTPSFVVTPRNSCMEFIHMHLPLMSPLPHSFKPSPAPSFLSTYSLVIHPPTLPPPSLLPPSPLPPSISSPPHSLPTSLPPSHPRYAVSRAIQPELAFLRYWEEVEGLLKVSQTLFLSILHSYSLFSSIA